MIRKTQIKFMALLMSILLVVFAIMFGASFLFLNIIKSRDISHQLDNTKSFCEKFEEENSIKDGIYATITEITNGNFVLSIEQIDSKAFNEIEAKDLINHILDMQIEFGNVSKYYFKIYPSVIPANEYTIIISDMTESIESYKDNLLNISMALLGAYLLLYILVWGVSYRIIQPLTDNLNKQRQFISNVSHELKTPITVVSANAEVLATQENNQWLDNIKSQTKRMEVLVEDMLTLAKLDEGVPLEISDFNISDEVINTVLPFEALAFEKGKFIETDISDNLTYHGDRQSVKKLLSILIDNAIKYSSENGTIKVSLKKEGHLVLKVYNTGSEIQPYEADKIFSRFYRGDNSRARSSGGSGLGLAIAKGICDTNRWKIYAKSIYNESMCITVII